MLSYRLLSMDTGIESGRLRTGSSTRDEWPVDTVKLLFETQYTRFRNFVI